MVSGIQKVYNLYQEEVNRKERGVTVMKGNTAKICAVTDSRLLGKLTKNVEVSCARCGAKAHDKNNVCEPIAIEPDH